MRKYTSLFLDLDNTLLDFNMAEKVAVEKVLQSYGLPHDEKAVKTYSDINRNYWERFERGEIEKSEIFEGRFKTFLSVYNLEADTAAISKDYCLNLSEGYFKIDGAIEILEYLKEKGYKLYATTNGLSLTQFKRIENSGLKPYFDKIFVSEQAGHQKPEKEYFDYVIDNIEEKDRSKMLIIGDSQSSDILGGINSSIDTCWFNPSCFLSKYKSNFEIASLYDIKKIL
ncbi:MAG: YjjG family noncanonical pyrimidine nucleotidase [Clostridia bacterium]|nr:YjjG family noncanonical pyrimidine nucleotidase [Clostridia bacterium]